MRAYTNNVLCDCNNCVLEKKRNSQLKTGLTSVPIPLTYPQAVLPNECACTITTLLLFTAQYIQQHVYLGSQFLIQIPVGLLGTRVRKVEAVALLRQNLVTCRALSSCRSDATSRSLTETWDLSSAAADSAAAWRSTRTGEELRSCSLQNSTAQLAYHALRLFLPQVLSLRLKRRYLLRTRDRASEKTTSDSKCMYMYCSIPNKHPWEL